MILAPWLVVAALVALIPAVVPMRPRQLRVDVPLAGESLLPEAEATYEITGLQPTAQYEIKISYPAVTPAIFDVTFLGDGPTTSRKLQNVHKEEFTTDEKGAVQVPDQLTKTSTTAMFVLKAHRDSIAYDPAIQSDEPIVFNIVVSPLFFGVPVEAFPLIVLGLGCILAAWLLSPRLLRLLLSATKRREKD
eukprot:NODE_7753_length_745_cov_79.590032_g7503_i0.p1 GENE.NODE_7753_length_745_cov_79.590032_g7503_i0~~NODE_7753_length_745_cov_79.590032_g7503_i0.p1  ORF type:complete len:214 (+),score=34.81 NODE_7753_length_745_cov_79.590032_g7503_i0:70-642(+)